MNLSGVNLFNANLSLADFFNAILFNASLIQAKLIQANLSDAYLIQANLSGADLNGADLSGADLNDADLDAANLSDANLDEASLSDANLSGANLSGANLTFADLSGADLNDADLNNANLSYTDLTNANLNNANLSYANLEAVVWNSDTKWLNAKGLHKTLGVSLELAQDKAFAAAFSWDQGISWVKEGKTKEAQEAFKQTLKDQPSLNDSAEFWNSICRVSCLHGHAKKVLSICEKAVTSDPNNKTYQDSRGLARVLTGDLVGALEDFQAAVDSGAFDYLDHVKQQRLRWIEALKSGNNPLTPEELEELREVEDYANS